MAQELAKPGHNAGNETLYAEMCKSYFRIEDDKNSLRQRHRSELGELTEQQADVKTRVKDAGFSQAAFMILVRQEQRRRAYEKRPRQAGSRRARAVASGTAKPGGRRGGEGGAWA